MAEMKTPKAKPPVLPKTMQACADLLYKTIQDRRALSKKVDEMEALETALEEKLREMMLKADITLIGGKLGEVETEKVEVPTVKDWDKFRPWAFKHPEVLQKRINANVIREHWDAKERIPGVDKIFVTKVHCRKR